MKLYEVLNINIHKKEMISFVGAGGKTTSMFKLAKELKATGKRVLVTTTTAIYYPEETNYDWIEIINKNNPINSSNFEKDQYIYVLGKDLSKENKLLGLSEREIEVLRERNLFDYILIEADGSKRKPIKAPAVHEPSIPLSTTKVIGVIGMDAFNQPIGEERVHRPELFCQLTGGKIGEKIDVQKILSLILREEGLFKNSPDRCQRYLLLNKIDNAYHEKLAYETFNLLKKEKCSVKAVIMAAMNKEENYIKWRGFL